MTSTYYIFCHRNTFFFVFVAISLANLVIKKVLLKGFDNIKSHLLHQNIVIFLQMSKFDSYFTRLKLSWVWGAVASSSLELHPCVCDLQYLDRPYVRSFYIDLGRPRKCLQTDRFLRNRTNTFLPGKKKKKLCIFTAREVLEYMGSLQIPIQDVC